MNADCITESTNNCNSKGKAKARKVPKVRSCDFCRNNKIRCDRLPIRCTNCAKRGLECTRNNPYQKRGPKPKKNLPGNIKTEMTYIEQISNKLNHNEPQQQLLSVGECGGSNNNGSGCNSYYYNGYNYNYLNNMMNISLDPISSPNSFDLNPEYLNSNSTDTNSITNSITNNILNSPILNNIISSPQLRDNLLNQLSENDLNNIYFFFNTINPHFNLMSQDYFMNLLINYNQEMNLIQLTSLINHTVNWYNVVGELKASQFIFQFRLQFNWSQAYSNQHFISHLNVILPAITVLHHLLKLVSWQY